MKTAERQAALLDHVAPKVRLRRNARDFLVRQRTQTANAIRAHLAEFGIVVAKGIHNLDRLIAAAQDVPAAARPALDLLAGQLRDLEERIEEATVRITAAQKVDPVARRLATVPGLGPIASSAFAATTPDVGAFRSARGYAASCQRHACYAASCQRHACGVTLGLTPRVQSSGGKERLGRINKAGNRYLRRLLCLGASCRRHASGVTARISARRGRRAAPAGSAPDWLDRMLARKPVQVVAIALAARMARTVWALIAHGDSYRATA